MVLVTFLTAVTKYLTKIQLKGGKVYSDFQFENGVHHGGEVGWSRGIYSQAERDECRC